MMDAEKSADFWSALGVAFMVGMITASAYYKVPELWQQQNQLVHVEKVVLPKAVAETKKATAVAKCEHKRADTAVIGEVQAVVAAKVRSVPIPDVSDLPACPEITKK